MWCFPNRRVYFSLNHMNQYAPNWDLEINKPKNTQIKTTQFLPGRSNFEALMIF